MDAENYLYEMQEEMKLWPDVEYPLFDEEITNREKGVARLSLSFHLRAHFNPSKENGI